MGLQLASSGCFSMRLVTARNVLGSQELELPPQHLADARLLLFTVLLLS